jgi:hypothetical protein
VRVSDDADADGPAGTTAHTASSAGTGGTPASRRAA